MELNIIERYLTPHPNSRRQDPLKVVKGIVLHWVAKPGQSASDVWQYFESAQRQASAHFIVDLDGTILKLMPLEEVAFHAGPLADTRPKAMERFGPWPNACLLGVETCHTDWKGQYTDAMIAAARELCACLCDMFNLSPDEDILRHWDITGKYCPRWWIDHPADWVEFKQSVKQRMLQVACAGAGGGN